MNTAQSLRAAALAAALLASPGLFAAEVAGVRVEEQIRVGNDDLVLNGAGVRSRFFIKVYVGALYMARKTDSPAAIIDSPAPRRLALHLLRDIDADTLFAALRNSLANNTGEAELAALKPQVDQFGGIMRRIDNAKGGETITLDFAGEGVTVSYKGEVRGTVAGAPFARALLLVWLGEKPVDAALKKALLGG